MDAHLTNSDAGVARVRRRQCSNDYGCIGTANVAKRRQQNDGGCLRPERGRVTLTFSSCRERNDGMGSVPGGEAATLLPNCPNTGVVESAEQGQIRTTRFVRLSSSNPTPR